MPLRHSVWPQAEMHFPPGDSRRATAAQHEARQSHLLAALPPDDFERLLHDLEPVPLPLGRTIHGTGEPEKYLYFITAGVAAKFLVLQNGASAEVAVAGREGVTEAAGKLQDEGLIHYRRGHISVSDRFRLEAQACECYAVVKREYQRLIPASS